MIEQLVQEAFLRDQLESVRSELEHLERDPSPSRRSGRPAPPRVSPADCARALAHVRRVEESGASWIGAGGRRGGADSSAEPFLPRDPFFSLLQSALEEELENWHADEIVEVSPTPGRRGAAEVPMTTHRFLRGYGTDTPSGRRLFGRFEGTDARWVACLLAYGLRLFSGKHPFNSEPALPVRLGERARLVLVGDWGSGLKRAQRVSEQMRRFVEEGIASQVDTHVIHLGDVYYSGYGWEYAKRFLPYWPVRLTEADRVGSWCVNANHDMYSGGYGYFNLLEDPRFARQGRSSWFSFLNDDWRVVGLDTAWDETGVHDPRIEHGLQDPQAERIATWAAADSRRLVLLSHHQLFSAYDDPGPYLRNRLADLLDRGRIKAWFWGHEHKAVAYAPFDGLEFGRCLGNGGVPVYPSRAAPRVGGPSVLWRENGIIDGLLENWATLGFAVVDLIGPEANVRYLDEFGRESFSEVLR